MSARCICLHGKAQHLDGRGVCDYNDWSCNCTKYTPRKVEVKKDKAEVKKDTAMVIAYVQCDMCKWKFTDVEVWQFPFDCPICGTILIQSKELEVPTPIQTLSLETLAMLHKILDIVEAQRMLCDVRAAKGTSQSAREIWTCCAITADVIGGQIEKELDFDSQRQAAIEYNQKLSRREQSTTKMPRVN